LNIEQGVKGGVVKRGVDVVGGVDKQEILFLLDELEGRECGELDCVALKWFEIKDVIRAFEEVESISALAALEGVITPSTAEGVIVLASSEVVVA
jgi:hypothetical protein